MSRALLVLVGCSATLLVFGLWIVQGTGGPGNAGVGLGREQARQSEARPGPGLIPGQWRSWIYRNKACP